jgi:hypothetical protein
VISSADADADADADVVPADALAPTDADADVEAGVTEVLEDATNPTEIASAIAAAAMSDVSIVSSYVVRAAGRDACEEDAVT